MSVISKTKVNKRLVAFISAFLVLLLFAGIALFAAINGGIHYTSSVNSEQLPLPQISSVSNTESGVQIEWGKVNGTEKYRVFYKNFLGVWVKIADTDSADYTWTGAKSGRKYTFAVRCVSADGKSYISGYDHTGKSITYIAAPKLISISNTENGVKIKWNKVTGAAKYRVLYKNSSDEWIKIDDTSFTDYTWEAAESGADYTFTVRCLSEDGKSFTSSYDPNGESITYIAAPKLISVIDTENGVKLTWDKVAGASKYRILYKSGSGDWSKLTDTMFTSYTWRNAERGKKYTFTVSV